MAVAFFIVPMAVKTRGGETFRYCAMDDYTADIRGAGGDWSDAEILGGHCVVKVSRLPQAGIDQLAVVEGFIKLPQRLLTATLGDLTAGQRQAIRDKALALGYTAQQITNALPDDWQDLTLAQVIRFLMSRWRRPLTLVEDVVTYEPGDWTSGPPRTLDDLDAGLTDG